MRRKRNKAQQLVVFVAHYFCIVSFKLQTRELQNFEEVK